MSNLQIQRKSLPNEPGVYLFLDSKKNVIYIGKALNLRKRVNQYFTKSHFNDPFYEEKIYERVMRIRPEVYDEVIALEKEIGKDAGTGYINLGKLRERVKKQKRL